MNHHHRFTTGVSLGVLLLLIAALLTGTALAQTGTSSVRGTVTDPQGSVIPKATVTLTSPETNQVRTQQTSGTGNFNFDFVPPGRYRLEVEASGFKKTAEFIDALIARPTEVAVRMQVGAASESVTVTAENAAVQVNTQDSAVGNNFVTEQIVQLPMEARNVLSLLTLQPGVTSDGYVAGARSDQSNITLDGMDINDAQTGHIDAPVLRLNSEAIEEFRLSTVTANANSGRSSGAQVQLVTKSGTNKIRGSLFEYHRNTLFTSNTYFNKLSDQPRPTLIRNTFGASIGGPIVKNKLFFFYSYEGRRDASQRPVESASTVPLPTLGQGIVRFPAVAAVFDAATGRYTAGDTAAGVQQLTPADIAAIFPDTGGVNAAAMKIFADAASKYKANDFTTGDSKANLLLNAAGYRFNVASPVKLNSHVARFDFNLTQKQTLFLRTNVIYDHDSSGLQPAFPDDKKPTLWSHPIGYMLGHTWTIHNNLVNNFSYGQTRTSYSSTGDLNGPNIRFRFIFYPTNAYFTSNRKTPVHKWADDLSWVDGNHTFQFGGTVINIHNARTTFSGAFDDATTNPFFYATHTIINSVNQYLGETKGIAVDSAFTQGTEAAIGNLIGRMAQYTAVFNFGHDGKLLPAGTPLRREFASQSYEGYLQDVWKMKPNITVTAGVRYIVSRPVYETHGFEVQPDIPLGTYFQRRVNGMRAGTPYNAMLSVNLSGPANGGKPLYAWDKTNVLPRIAVAWSPRPQSSLLSRLFGSNGQSVIRGGFAMLSDYFGQQLAVTFDARNQLGFAGKQTSPANSFNIGCGHYVVVGNNMTKGCSTSLAPLFTGYDMAIRNFPLITPPTSLTFPQQQTALRLPTRIEETLDSTLVTPKNYVISLTFERELPHGLLFQTSYIGRMGRNLLAKRDVATPNNLVDPKSGMDWYTAATILEKARQAGVDSSYFQTHPIPYFENLWPGLPGVWGYSPGTTATLAVYEDAQANSNDWTTTQLDIDRRSIIPVVPGQTYSHAFYGPQYGALGAWSSIANSNYHALTVSMRERLRDLTLDVNYTWSHSLDDASGLQTAGYFSTSALILNPFRQRDNYAASDFDHRHVLNVNAVYQLPFGRGKMLAGNANGVLDAIIGGWQVSSIFRYHTGAPFGAPYDDGRWATNWEIESYATATKHLPPGGCPTKGSEPKFFGNCLVEAFQAFRNAYPGETGQRNYFRYLPFWNGDLGIGKSWKMPYHEGHELQFRAEVFNLTNTQIMGDPNWGTTGWGIPDIPANTKPDAQWSNFAATQTSTSTAGNTQRVMQFGLTYRF